MKEILERISKENGWDDWNEVIFTGDRRTVFDILDEAINEFENLY